MTSMHVGTDRLGQGGDMGREVRRPEIARPEFHGRPKPDDQNVGQMERIVGGVAGVLLTYYGLKRMSLGGLLVAGVGSALVYRSTSGYCPAYGVLGIDTAGKNAARPEDFFERGVHVEQAYLIHKPVEDVYAFWRDFTNLPAFMQHLDNVEVLSPSRSRWTAKAPLGRQVSWEAEIIHDQPNELIAWKSVEHSTIANAGTVKFTKRDQEGQPQTEVKVILDYIPPAGTVGKVIAQMFGSEPSQTIKEDLRRFKMVMEAGEVATTDGQPQGRCG
jgi:uncharacterized membrane protein